MKQVDIATPDAASRAGLSVHTDHQATPTPIVPAFSLREWRIAKLAQLKQRDEYKKLAERQRRIVDHIVRRYLNPLEGAFPKHATLAERFGVNEKTIDRDMKRIRDVGIFLSSPRYRGAGTAGGRTSNRLSVNPEMLPLMATAQGWNVPQPLPLLVPEPVPQPVPAEASKQVEAFPRQRERQIEALEAEGASASELGAATARGAAPTPSGSQLVALQRDPRELPWATGSDAEPWYAGSVRYWQAIVNDRVEGACYSPGSRVSAFRELMALWDAVDRRDAVAA